MTWEITTCKGGRRGTLLECLEWQAAYQGAMADIIASDGRVCRIGPGTDLDIAVAAANDPYREDGDLTPDEAAEAIERWFDQGCGGDKE